MRREISTGLTQMMQNFIHQFALAVLPMLDRATTLARQAEQELEAAQRAGPECVNLDLSPRSLDRLLRGARAAVSWPAQRQPVPINADLKN
jgi:hypothetical protein